MTLVTRFNKVMSAIQSFGCWADWESTEFDFGTFKNIKVYEWIVPTGGDNLTNFFRKMATLENLLNEYADCVTTDEGGNYSVHIFNCGKEIAFTVSVAPLWL